MTEKLLNDYLTWDESWLDITSVRPDLNIESDQQTQVQAQTFASDVVQENIEQVKALPRSELRSEFQTKLGFSQV